ncbi:hypothetical protein F4819DRAFT_448407 [Hypoxylon fuscum]|nr:hypothetical protein F4819DRAFT_448407 [Hypoxylon fuscum]
MATPSHGYGALGPIQQYNQLSFSPIPLPQQAQHLHHQPQHQQNLQSQQQHPQQQHHNTHPQPHHQPHHQLQQQRQPSQTTTPVPAPTYQPPPALPPTNNTNANANANVNGAVQQQNANANASSHVAPSTTTAPPPTAPTTTTTAPAAEPQPKRRRVGRPSKWQTARDYQAQRAASGLPPPPPPPQVHTPHPLSRGPYNTAEDATFSLQLHVFTSGYGVSQKRTVKEKLPSGRYDPEGEVIRRDFACDRGGSEFVSQSTGERRRESKKCGCPWRAVSRRLKREGDLWFVEILEPNHNHPVTPPDQMHTIASYRRWQKDNNAGIRGAIDRLTRAAAMPARQVASYLKGEYADPELDRIDRHILRALSMSDVEVQSDAASQNATVFEIVGKRPTIILQEGMGGPGAGVGDGNVNMNVGAAANAIVNRY